MEASISLSYALLSPEMQQRWRMLGVFPDTFDASAAAALMMYEQIGDPNAATVRKQFAEWRASQ